MEKEYTIRKVKDYNPYNDLIASVDVETGIIMQQADGEERLYLPAAAQEKWFWLYCEEKGIDGRIVSYPLTQGNPAIHEFETKVFMNDMEVSTGHAMKYSIEGVTEKFPPYETAETISRSRALSAAGFGSEISVYLRKRDAENAANAKPEKPETKGKPEAEKAKAEAEKAIARLGDPFAAAGVTAPKPATETKPEEKTEPTPKKETPDKKAKATPKKEKAEAKPEPKTPTKEEKPKKEAEKAESKVKAEEKPKTAEKKAEKKAEPFVITTADVGHIPSIRGYVGKDISAFSKENLQRILDMFGEKISDAFKEAIKERL